MRSHLPTSSLPLCFALSMLATAALPAAVDAQTAEVVQRVRRELAEREPDVSTTARQALRYFRVHPEVIDELRSAARRRGRRPILAVGYQFGQDEVDRFEDTTGTAVTQENEDRRSRVHGANVGLLWDLRQVAFNPAEIDAYGLVAVQRDLLLEVTRTFFLRRQLQLRIRLRPPEDPLAYAALELRIAEFTAILDTLTGGWFSQHAEGSR